MSSWMSDYLQQTEAIKAEKVERQRSLAAEYARSTEHLYSIRTAVVIPLMQALVMGFGVGVIAGVITTRMDTDIPAWFVFGIVLSIVGLLTWAWRLRDWSHSIGLLERLVNWDIDGNGVVGNAEPDGEELPERSIHVEVISQNGKRGQYIDIPDTDAVQAFADAVAFGVDGKPAKLTHEAWTGSGKPFGRAEYERFILQLIDEDLAYWKDPYHHNLGIVMTEAGIAVMRDIASQYPPTPPRHAS